MLDKKIQNSPAQDTSPQNINEAALSYMEQKYGEKFEYVAPWGNSMSGTHQLLVSCASFPGEEIAVQVENNRAGDKVFRDNYLAVKYQQQTAGFFEECSKKVFTEAEAFCVVRKDGLSEDLPANASFEEYLSDSRANLVILVEVRESDFEDESQLNELVKLVGKYGTRYLLKTVIVKDGDFGSYDAYSLEDVIGKTKLARCVIVDNSRGKTEIRWFGE